jgi:hypothetical protein
MENLKVIYAHLSPDKFSFSNELELSKYTFSELPEYANISLQQCELFLGNEPILLTNENISIDNHKKIHEFYELCKKYFPSFYKDPFWLLTLIRLYAVYLYCVDNKINEFVHTEYDNLLYSDFKILKKLPQSIYFTRVGPYCSSAGFVYCNSLDSFSNFIKKLKQLITKGEHIVRQFTKYDHLSEMILIDLIYDHSKNIIDYLPILPEGVGSDNFAKLGVLFDGASYGQYLGGTNNGAGPGWTGDHHYAGKAIQSKKIKVLVDTVPYVLYNNKLIPILNLHIHSKNLHNFNIKQ